MSTVTASIPDSIIVAGGKATRMGGLDKAMLPLGLSGKTLLEDIIKSCPGKVFVVGNPREIGIDGADVTWVPDLNPDGDRRPGSGQGWQVLLVNMCSFRRQIKLFPVPLFRH